MPIRLQLVSRVPQGTNPLPFLGTFNDSTFTVFTNLTVHLGSGFALFVPLESGSQVAQAGLKLTMWSRMTLNSGPTSGLHLCPRAGITGRAPRWASFGFEGD